MERRDRSLEALKKLYYIDSLDDTLRASSLLEWVNKYLPNSDISNFDLDVDKMKEMSELFYKNILFLKKYQENLKTDLNSYSNMKKFLH